MEDCEKIPFNHNCRSYSSRVSSPDIDMMLFIILAASIQANFSEADHTVSAAIASSTSVGGGGAGVGGSGGGSGAF
ncbi:hypothetical protein [Halobacillus sp. K22]|uniref:hypothetical protein n=1 Tax=Halobacillus sp. K22 TaxID=3457431 RepID=UPI003FCC79F3